MMNAAAAVIADPNAIIALKLSVYPGHVPVNAVAEAT